MLVLSRKNHQAVIVGGAGRFEHIIKITVLDIIGGNVKLGFEANRNVPVHREEVWLLRLGTGGREPPVSLADPTESNGKDGNAPLLSETGKGKEPAPSEAQASRT